MDTSYSLPQYRINADGSVNLPFGRAIEAYLNSLPLLTNCKLKKQSRLYVNENIRAGFITLKRVEGAIDYLAWKTRQGKNKSTNRLDDIIELTSEGRNRVIKIKQHDVSNITVWRWVLFCDGNNDCERECGGLGICKSECSNFNLNNNLKSDFDMHKCAVRVITKVMLSDVEDPLPVQLIVKGTHRSSSIPAAEPKLGKINLSLQARDKAIIARRGHHSSGTEIAMKILAPYNNTNETDFQYIYKTSRDLCTEQQLKRLVERDDHRLRENTGPWTILDQLITGELKTQGKVLYYQRQNISASKDSPEYYYQLTLSDDLWLQQGRDCGHFCFGIDGKYDLNNEGAPVLAIVIEDQAGYGSPLAFGFSNKENHFTIRLAVQAVKANIPCDNPQCTHQYQYIDLPNRCGFKRICECTSYWNPLAMMDKHRPTKLALQNLVRGTTLCWFHVMATLGEHLQKWKVDWNFRYPIALAFKVVGRCKSDEEAIKTGDEYKKFIYSLLLDNDIKEFLVHDLEMNWICDEWRQSFIDGGREPQVYDLPGAKPMTTNNLTERMNKTIESRRSGTQTVVSFVERLYGIKSIKQSLVQNELGKTLFDAGLSTYWNMRTIEHKRMPVKKPIDKKRRLNQGRLYSLLGFVIPLPEQTNYILVKKQNTRFYSPYNNHRVSISTEVLEKIDAMIIKLINRNNIDIPVTHYLVNLSTNECTCYDYIWNGPFRDVCKHIHAAHIYLELSCGKLQRQDIKEKLVSHFKNKERAVALEYKNWFIYNGTIEQAYQEILRLFDATGDDIFFPNERQTTIKDPFRPIDKIQIPTTIGAPKIHGAKYRKPNRLFNIPNTKLLENYMNNFNQEYIYENANAHNSDNCLSESSNQAQNHVNSFNQEYIYENADAYNYDNLDNCLSESSNQAQNHMNSFNQEYIYENANAYDYNNSDNCLSESTNQAQNRINSSNQEYIYENVDAHDYDNSDNYIPYSVQRRNTTRIRKKRRTSAQTHTSSNEKENNTKRLLEELFLERECNWNPKEFTNAAVTKRLHLDDNPVENGVKLYRWISNRKMKAKNTKT
ncbi:proteophosphoglycan ppg4 [Gigaspora margarita]|uniref:Proteophosphoglycan ppg4 n=1 Tax=Gigaspora margarita TaxID=4874 RepID=A0A8H3XBZ4_GIGMA|nr:proteophosphoglycan ppg4 [Gigaspora margarita]